MKQRERRNSIWKKYSETLRFTLIHRVLKYCQGHWLCVRISRPNCLSLKTQSNLSKFLQNCEQEKSEIVLHLLMGLAPSGMRKWTLHSQISIKPQVQQEGISTHHSGNFHLTCQVTSPTLSREGEGRMRAAKGPLKIPSDGMLQGSQNSSRIADGPWDS